MRIIVTGLVGLFPVGGVAWDYLQYVIGLSKLGHDVFYYEDTWSWPYQPEKKTFKPEGDYSARFLKHFFDAYAPELNSNWYYLHLHDKGYGMARETFNDFAHTADLFLNVSGSCIIPDKLSSNCVKVFLDTDPGYNQIVLSEKFWWSENVERWCASVEAHDRFFTYAENINQSDCIIPKVGISWKTTRMPIVTDLWNTCSRSTKAKNAPWTTIMTWDAFKGKLVYNGIEYKSKGSEFEKIINLPCRVDSPFKVAVGGLNAPIESLSKHGWEVVDGLEASKTPNQYQTFISTSRGEFATAKHVYVAMRSGWFSCRSACYLASGRPVVIQNTAISRVIPTGLGIMTFTNIEEAIAAINEVETNYEKHSKASFELVEEFFNSDRILKKLIDDILTN
jgi:hypothetical protein